ncbi:aldo/keto reductase [Clostridium magnum]|uniref:Aldo/keto reductase family protein n=1 Tax=Clostridium magnum DSM 2767 TaxID=1121326 RepID=A0A162UMY3_9CLOT|nr:aldo/keto reductase [Clostridium magnum]KZL94094.1 aldo/keto reductase family protein [Clostridium magnum DSM 2767]SHH95117.1 Aldo/keto reductase family protein [Clostridium magnum DSM 2767]
MYIKNLKQQGLIDKLGVSIYDTEEMEYIIDNLSNSIDIVELSFNIFDLKWLKKDLLKKAKLKNIEIAVRSVFLQGLFFTDKLKASKVHNNAYEYIKKLRGLCEIKETTIEQLALSFIKGNEEIDYILIGCENEKQLIKNIRNFDKKINFTKKDKEYICESFGNIEKRIINPRMWK